MTHAHTKQEVPILDARFLTRCFLIQHLASYSSKKPEWQHYCQRVAYQRNLINLNVQQLVCGIYSLKVNSCITNGQPEIVLEEHRRVAVISTFKHVTSANLMVKVNYESFCTFKSSRKSWHHMLLLLKTHVWMRNQNATGSHTKSN